MKNLDDIHELLIRIDEKLNYHLKWHEEINPKLTQLISIMEQRKGQLSMAKAIPATAAIVAGAIYWMRDHIKW